MELIEASIKEKSRQHIHGWENITLVEVEAALSNKLLRSLHS